MGTEIFGGKVNVVHDVFDGEDILRFSKLKNGSGIITQQFSNDLALQIKNDFGRQMAAAPNDWGIVSIGSSQFLGEFTARILGLPHAHIRLDDFSFLNVKNYDAAETFEERNKIFYRKCLTLEKRRRFKVKNVILVDDMLNRGVSLTRGKEFIEGGNGMRVAGTYVLFSISHMEDASLEARISNAFIEKEGMSALIKMINEEDVFVTRRLMKSIFYHKDRLRIFFTLNPEKRLMLLSKGFVSMSAKIWVIMKARTVTYINMMKGKMKKLGSSHTA